METYDRQRHEGTHHKEVEEAMSFKGKQVIFSNNCTMPISPKVNLSTPIIYLDIQKLVFILARTLMADGKKEKSEIDFFKEIFYL